MIILKGIVSLVLALFVLLFTVALIIPQQEVQAQTTTSVPCSVADLLTAISTANSTSGDDILNLSTDCIYALTAVDNTTNGPNGLPVILDAATAGTLTIQGNGAAIIRDTAPSFRIFYIELGGDLTLDNLTITSGVATSGGGIFNDNGTVTLNNSTVSNNTASAGGGGIHNDWGTVTLNNSTVSNNYASTGGGIFNFGTVNILNGSRVEDNLTSNNGGGINNEGNTVVVDNSTISGNRSAYLHGGGINSNFHGMVTIRNGSTIANNSAPLNHGGGVHSDGTVIVENSTFSDNSAGAEGGGIKTYDSGAVNVTNSVFTGNRAASGGAIANWTSNTTVTDSTFIDNTGTYRGGALYKLSGTITITNSTFSENSAPTGGALYNLGSGSTSITGSCIVDNADVAVENTSGIVVTATGNWWGRADGAGPVSGGSGDTISTGVDPGAHLTTPILGCQTLAPEINVRDSAATTIPDGGSFTFPPTIEEQSVSETFTVENAGNAFLLLSGLTVPPDFSITADFSPVWSVAGAPKDGGTATFTIQCDADALGSYSGTLTFDNNDSDENPFNFTVQCTVAKVDTTTIITSDTPDPSRVNEPVTVAFSVTAALPGITPTGNVTITAGADSCTATVAQGSCTITFATAGPKTLVATYGGNDQFNGSTSPPESHTVVVFEAISEEALFNQFVTEIVENQLAQDINFVLPDFVPGGVNYTVRTTDGTVGEVVVAVIDEGTGFVLMQIGSITVDGADAPAHYVASINRELIPLFIGSLDALVEQSIGPGHDLDSMTITDTVIDATFTQP